MKVLNNIVIVLLIFSFFSCSNSETQEQNQSESATTISQPTQDSHADHDHTGHDHAGHNHGEAKHHKSSPLSPFVGIWTYFASTHNPDYYKNRWIEFSIDGTFENGKDGKQTNSGKWTFDASSKIINLDFKDNSVEKDEEWKTQLNSPILLLLGNSPNNKTGAQIKLDLVEQRPTE